MFTPLNVKITAKHINAKEVKVTTKCKTKVKCYKYAKYKTF